MLFTFLVLFFAKIKELAPVKGQVLRSAFLQESGRGGRVTTPIRTRSNVQKTHIYGVKAAYNMSYIISPLFLVSAHFLRI